MGKLEYDESLGARQGGMEKTYYVGPKYWP
jgi:hypothetical protein